MKTFAELGFPGRLIAVEGLDGSGKSTQIYLLKRWLELQELKVYFSEWNSSELVKAATSKGKKRELLTPTTFSLIHATDFADRYERHLVPLLRAGYIVLCDRYIFTAFARDVVHGRLPNHRLSRRRNRSRRSRSNEEHHKEPYRRPAPQRTEVLWAWDSGRRSGATGRQAHRGRRR